MKRYLFTVISILSFSLLAQAQTKEGNFVDAVSLYTNGEYTKASRVFETLSAADPDNDAVCYYLGMSQIYLQEYDKAETNLRKAVSLDSGNFWYRKALARFLLARGRTEEVISEYESLVKDFPSRSQLSYELLDLYLRAGSLEKALSTLDDIEAVYGTSEDAVRTRYDIYSSLGRHEDAISALEDFNSQYSSPMILSMAGDYYLADFQDSLAAARYSEALELDSSYMPAVLGTSEVYRHKRRYPEYFATMQGFFGSEDVPAASKGIYLRNMTRTLDPKIIQIHRAGFDSLAMTAVRMHPSDTTVLSEVGTYFYSTGRQDQAGEWFLKAADTCPESMSLTVTAVQYLGLRERWTELRDRSLAAFGSFRELAFLDYANMANYNLGDYDAIIGNCRYIIKYYPDEEKACLSAWSSIGDAYHEKGDVKAAYKAYEKALKIDPSYAPVLNNYAYYLSMEGKKLKKAYAMSKKTVEAEPDNATYLDTFAWILHLQGKDVEAKPFFKHAMLYGGKDSAVILNHFAEVLEALGEEDLAKIYRAQAKAKK